MTSTIRSVPGGGFGRTSRFKTKYIDTPGPDYNLPTMLSDHIQAPAMAKFDEPTHVNPHRNPTMPNPAKDRTAWMIGQTKDDLAYFADVADRNGPAWYKPDAAVIKPLAHRPRFAKNPRFQQMTKQYVSKAHNQANLCTAGPGPKYKSETTQMDLNKAVPPRWGMGRPTEYNTTRNSFLQGTIKDGFMYRAIAATQEKKAVVSAATYSPNLIKTGKRRSIQQKFDKNDRFKNNKKQYQGKKMAHNSLGLDSPGPSYDPQNRTLSKWAKKKNVQTPQGKWCP